MPGRVARGTLISSTRRSRFWRDIVISDDRSIVEIIVVGQCARYLIDKVDEQRPLIGITGLTANGWHGMTIPSCSKSATRVNPGRGARATARSRVTSA